MRWPKYRLATVAGTREMIPEREYTLRLNPIASVIAEKYRLLLPRQTPQQKNTIRNAKTKITHLYSMVLSLKDITAPPMSGSFGDFISKKRTERK